MAAFRQRRTQNAAFASNSDDPLVIEYLNNCLVASCPLYDACNMCSPHQKCHPGVCLYKSYAVAKWKKEFIVNQNEIMGQFVTFGRMHGRTDDLFSIGFPFAHRPSTTVCGFSTISLSSFQLFLFHTQKCNSFRLIVSLNK